MMIYAPSVLLVLFAATTSAALVNRTIDDQNGDEVTKRQVEYTGLWRQGKDCPAALCSSRPSGDQIHDGTWHDASYFPSHEAPPQSLSFKFNGTAVYVYFILQKLQLTDVDVSIDGGPASNFNHVIDATSNVEFDFNVPIFVQEGLLNGEHTFTVTASGPNFVLMLFDYAIYTADDSGPSISLSLPSSSLQPSFSNTPHLSGSISASQQPPSLLSVPLPSLSTVLVTVTPSPSKSDTLATPEATSTRMVASPVPTQSSGHACSRREGHVFATFVGIVGCIAVILW
ncbi:hypothetical protein BXZ70DRAFT_802396 [Cristinia sonorae]|uniref:Uncharacterized protein n=1 Tax=Cristinia sonorae TaxID=1940300 RepID=A0A8K0UT17_9AGAR|nr:hypothetical protein BXZ70DRAFT_802396 [Cristinia sonorae]